MCCIDQKKNRFLDKSVGFRGMSSSALKSLKTTKSATGTMKLLPQASKTSLLFYFVDLAVHLSFLQRICHLLFLTCLDQAPPDVCWGRHSRGTSPGLQQIYV